MERFLLAIPPFLIPVLCHATTIYTINHSLSYYYLINQSFVSLNQQFASHSHPKHEPKKKVNVYIFLPASSLINKAFRFLSFIEKPASIFSWLYPCTFSFPPFFFASQPHAILFLLAVICFCLNVMVYPVAIISNHMSTASHTKCIVPYFCLHSLFYKE